MKPVTQEITSGGNGDCLTACLASLLEIEAGDVPKFRRDHGPEGMMPAPRRWLKENFGLSLIYIDLKRLRLEKLGMAPGQLCIAVVEGVGPGGPPHAVVGQITGNRFEQLHDPHPGGRGILGDPIAVYFLMPIDPGGIGPKDP
jgi:hypothetical protein